MKRIHIAAALLCMLIIPTIVQPDGIVIVVNPENTQDLRIDDVARIYLGKQSRFPDGREAVPLDIQPDDPVYEKFAAKVLKKTPGQLRAYWAKRIFTGKGSPPKRVSRQQDVRELVAEEPSHLGYIDSTLVDKTVRPAITIANDK